jgi:hypothetical protein
VKENNRGRFFRIAEILADGRRSQIIMSLATAALFRQHLVKISGHWSMPLGKKFPAIGLCHLVKKIPVIGPCHLEKIGYCQNCQKVKKFPSLTNFLKIVVSFLENQCHDFS